MLSQSSSLFATPFTAYRRKVEVVKASLGHRASVRYPLALLGLQDLDLKMPQENDQWILPWGESQLRGRSPPLRKGHLDGNQDAPKTLGSNRSMILPRMAARATALYIAPVSKYVKPRLRATALAVVDFPAPAGPSIATTSRIIVARGDTARLLKERDSFEQMVLLNIFNQLAFPPFLISR